ncbi:uncharacterized protein [Antedon mediterranea]|uniref:uncharacterized protein n=1 Tax=Antedon mediterranea TaxID=105859 RepID=UPI003AF6F604
MPLSPFKIIYNILLVFYCSPNFVLYCSSIYITEGPTDKRVGIGSNVVLKCLVSDINGEHVRWMFTRDKTTETISQDRALWATLSAEKKLRFSIDASVQNQFNLEIERVLYSDRGTYECVFMRYDKQWIGQSFKPSAVANLTVLKEPSRDSPVCTIIKDGIALSITGQTPTLQGDGHVQFQCSSHSHGYTTPNITLLLSGVAYNGTNNETSVYDLKTITSNAVSPEQGMTVRCILESEALQEMRTCQLMPEVQPVINIQPNNVTMNVGHEVKFNCIASGFSSEIHKYNWKTSPELSGSDTNQVNSSSLYITLPDKPCNCFYHVSCEVQHLNETYTASTVIHVNNKPMKTSEVNTNQSNNNLAVLSLLFLILILVISFFIWKRHKKQKLNRFKGALRYTIEPSTNSSTNVPIRSSSGNNSPGDEFEKPVTRSSSIKESLYAKVRKLRKSQDFSIRPVNSSNTNDDRVQETVNAIIENHRLSSEIDPRSSFIDENLTSIDEDSLPKNNGVHEAVTEDLSNEVSTAHIYENVVIKLEEN